MLFMLKILAKMILERAKYIYMENWKKVKQNTTVETPAVPFFYDILFGQMEVCDLTVF